MLGGIVLISMTVRADLTKIQLVEYLKEKKTVYEEICAGKSKW